MRINLKTTILLITSVFVMYSCKKENNSDSKLRTLKVGYHFDDFSKGNAIDFSGNNVNGDPYDLQLVDGKFGKGVLFNKPDSKIELSGLGDFENGITIDFWIYLNEQSDNNYKNIIEEGTTFSNLTFQIGIKNDSVLFDFCKSGNIYHGVKSSHKLPEHTWTHLSFNYNGSEIKLYINGILDDSNAALMGAIDSWNTLTIGQYNASSYSEYSSDTFYGILDEFRIWNYCYSEQEVKNFLMLTYSF